LISAVDDMRVKETLVAGCDRKWSVGDCFGFWPRNDSHCEEAHRADEAIHRLPWITPLVALACAAICASCAPASGAPQVSRSLALSADGRSLWVVNTESDSISQIDLTTGTLAREILLGSSPPAVDPHTGRYEPAIRPRAIALVDSPGKAYVAAQAANAVFVIDTHAGVVTHAIPTGVEPTAVVATRDGGAVYVVNHESATVQKIDTATDAVIGTVAVSEHPWGAALRGDEADLYVTQWMVNPGVTIISTASFAVVGFTPLVDQPLDASQNPQFPNGQVRAVYAVVPRPGVEELWVPHELHSNNTPEPALAFNTAAFPAVSRISAGGVGLSGTGVVDNRILFQPPLSLLGPKGYFIDVVSGPRDLAFTPDGSVALMANAQSEDVMVFDANSGYEISLVRPTPSGLIEGIVVDATGTHAYLHGRSTHNVTVLAIATDATGVHVEVEGSPIECLASDPMPSNLRAGMRLFYSANSALFPITNNFWITCSTCHPEGQTDAVTWRLLQGPRDTPSLAGGTSQTGFLMRQALRNSVVQFDETIRALQGGSYQRDNADQLPGLEALADFVNDAIPLPQNPNLDPGRGLDASQAHGQELFSQHCATCHPGAWYTDSGQGNPSLNLAGPVTLHDVGTCVTSGPYPDQPSTDEAGDPRAACQFNTPTLRGVFATDPYFHDGSAPTLADAVSRDLAAAGLSSQDQADLVAFLKTL
jgi:YVTN family beta-propeller protein